MRDDYWGWGVPDHLDQLNRLAEELIEMKRASGRLQAVSQSNQEENNTMIDVARIVFEQGRSYNRSSFGRSSYPDYSYYDKSAIDIKMDATGIQLTVESKPTEDNSTQKTTVTVTDPKKIIAFAQTLMKAAESQTEYAEKAKALAEERAALDATFKDRISGLGITAPSADDMLVVSRKEN